MQVNFLNRDYSVDWWEGQKLSDHIAVDTETTIAPFNTTPDMVVAQAYDGGNTVYCIERSRIIEFIELHKASNLIFHNAPFDVDVICKLSKDPEIMRSFYESSQILDTSVLYRLLHLAKTGMVPFRYNLSLVSEKMLGTAIAKEDTPRMEFGNYLGKEKELPHDFLEYAAIDVLATYKAFWELEDRISQTKSKTLLSHQIQVMGDLAINHMRKRGMRFDLKLRDEWLAEQLPKLQNLGNLLACYGWMRGVKGSDTHLEAELIRYGLEDKIPRTFKDKEVRLSDGVWVYSSNGQKCRNKTGTIPKHCYLSSKRKDLIKFVHIPFIKYYLDYISLEKETTFVRDITEERVHPSYNLLVDTGRTSCRKPNFQQLPRAGQIRNMWHAKEGHTLLITDYSTLELACLAQVLYKRFGYSVMMEKINEGIDLHKYYASVLYSCEIEEVTKEQRQSAKAANFGFPGGLGVKAFVEYATGYGVKIDMKEGNVMRESWFEAFPEMREYLKGENGTVMTFTGRIRGNTRFTNEKNTPFQGLGADGAKIALYNLDKAGFPIVGFVHDEVVSEIPNNPEDIEKYRLQQEKIMIDSMKLVVPDVEITVESTISERYCK